MKKDLGIIPAVYPMPVLMVATYDEEGAVDVMAAAWAMICEPDEIALFLDRNRKTTANILKNRAFTVSLADRAHMEAADYFGLVSGSCVKDKFERTGLTAVPSPRVNAPVIDEFPVVMECELAEVVDTVHVYCLIGKILNTQAEERVLAENGKIDPARCGALIYDELQRGYYCSGEKVGQAFCAGLDLMKQAQAKKR